MQHTESTNVLPAPVRSLQFQHAVSIHIHYTVTLNFALCNAAMACMQLSATVSVGFYCTVMLMYNVHAASGSCTAVTYYEPAKPLTVMFNLVSCIASAVLTALTYCRHPIPLHSDVEGGISKLLLVVCKL